MKKQLKIFVSQPMNGKTNEEIEKERKFLIEMYLKQTKCDPEGIKVIDSFFKDAPHDAKPLWYLGESFKKLSEADVAVFAPGWKKARGCRLEHEACVAYGIKAIELLEGFFIFTETPDSQVANKATPLAGTVGLMLSPDYKKRFVAEYLQTKYRYESLKKLNNKIDATKAFAGERDFLGFEPTCPSDILKEQQSHMGIYLHDLEVRAVMEGVNLPLPKFEVPDCEED